MSDQQINQQEMASTSTQKRCANRYRYWWRREGGPDLIFLMRISRSFLPSSWDRTRCISALRASTRFSESLTWWVVRARMRRSMPLDRILRSMTDSARSRFPSLTCTTMPRACCTCPRCHASIADGRAAAAAAASPRAARATACIVSLSSPPAAAAAAEHHSDTRCSRLFALLAPSVDGAFWFGLSRSNTFVTVRFSFCS